MKNKSEKNTDPFKHYFDTAMALILAITLTITAMPSPACATSKTVSFSSQTKVKKLKKTKVTTKKIQLKWSKMKGASGYEIYRDTSKKGKFRKIATSKKSSFTNKKLTAGKKYFYKIRAYQKSKKTKKYSRFSSILMVKTKEQQTGTTQENTSAPTAAITSSPVETEPAASSPTSMIAASISPVVTVTPLVSQAPSNNFFPAGSPTVSLSPDIASSSIPVTDTLTSLAPATDSPTGIPAETDVPASLAPATDSPACTPAETNVPASLAPATDSPATSTPVQYIQDLDYGETTAKINNPDQGFYRPIYVKVTEDSVSYAKYIVTDSTQLYHLRIDISAFSKAVNGTEDKPLTEDALSGIDELLSFLYTENKSAIARFVYDPGMNGASNQEPSLDMIVQHIRQLSTILNKYPDTLSAIEVGLIGPWGEMHTSTMATKEVINTLIDTYLDNTQEIPVLARTPAMIYNYLGITLDDLDNYTIESTSKAYHRLGIFNDGYLGSSTDLGTYTNREKEILWLSTLNSYLPYGGEVVTPDSELHNIENCLGEMFQLHLSYLDVEWNNLVIDKWKDSLYTEAVGEDSLYWGKTAFDYIEDHFGYRYVLTNSILEYDESPSSLAIYLSLANKGFGNLNRTKQMTLLFQDEAGEITEAVAGTFSGEDKITIQDVPLNLANGTYQVYLKIDNGEDKYALRFANDLWDGQLQANLIGTLHV